MENRDPSWSQAHRWAVSPEPAMAVGALSGPREYQFTQVVDAALKSDGRVVVVDGGDRSVRLYDSDGVFQGTLGGPGSGPGEFVDPVSVLVEPGDTLVVWDQGLLRSTRYSPEGDLLDVRSIDWGRLAERVGVTMASGVEKGSGKGTLSISGLAPGPMEPVGHGRFLVRLVEKSAKASPSGHYRPKSGALLVSQDLSNVDTLMFFGGTEQFVAEAPWGPNPVTPPWARQTGIAHQAGRDSWKICVGEQEKPEIVCFPGNGEPILIRWAPESLPVPEEGRDAWRNRIAEEYQGKLSRPQVESMLDQVPVPDRLPPYSGILLDSEGNLWVQRGPVQEGASSVDFLVFDADGALLGVVAVPPIRVLEIGTDYLLGVHRDDLGIHYVHLYDLGKPSPPAG